MSGRGDYSLFSFLLQVTLLMQTLFEAQTSLVSLLRPVVHQSTEADGKCIEEMFSEVGMEQEDDG